MSKQSFQEFNCFNIITINLKINMLRKLGTTILIKQKSVAQAKLLIRDGLANHGVIRIPKLDLDPQKMVKVTRQFIGQPILLPPEMAFNNVDPSYKHVCRVGNIRADGSVIENSFHNAEYWHQDGDFWEQQAKLIVNLLHSKIVPQQGGQTLFLDLVEANQVLERFNPKIYKLMQNYQAVVDLKKIKDFTLSLQNKFICEQITLHPLIKTNFINKKTCLNLCYSAIRTKQGEQVSDQDFNNHCLNPVRIIDELLTKMQIYEHKWQQGDLLIWDNTQVLHRSKGSWKGKRLLLRTQGDFKKPIIF